MNKNKYKDNYILVVKALQKARNKYPEAQLTNLYITQENGLVDIPFLEIKDILNSLHTEGIISIVENPKMSKWIEDEKPHSLLGYSDSPFLEIKEPNPKQPLSNMPENYFSVMFQDKFDYIANAHGSPIFLLTSVPSSKGKYKYIYRIAKKLVHKEKIENYELAKAFKSSLLKRDYKNKTERNKYNDKIKNCLKTLRKLFKPFSYKIKFHTNATELVKI